MKNKLRSILKLKKFLPIIIIFAIGTYFRLYDFPKTIGWNGDIGRDFLAGYLIAEKKAFTQIGHANSGIGYYYPPYYYYFIALLHKIMNTKQIFLFFVLSHSVSIVILYFTVKNFFTKNIAILTSLLFSLSPIAISIATIPITAHFSLIIFITSLYFFSSYLRSKKKNLLTLSILLLIITTTIFYGAIFFIPVYAYLLWFKSKKENKLNNLYRFIIQTIIMFFILFIPVMNKNEAKKLFFISTSYLEQNYTLNINSITKQINRIFIQFKYIVLPFITLCLLLIKKRKKELLFLLQIIISMLLIIGFNKESLDHYLILLTPIWYISISLIFFELLSQKKLLIAVLYSLIIITSTGIYNPLKFVTRWTNYETYKILLNKLSLSEQENVYMSSKFSQNNWDSRSLWYLLKNSEFEFNSNNSQINLKHNNSAKTFYICKKFDKNEEKCSFLKNNNNLILSEQFVINYINFDIYIEK